MTSSPDPQDILARAQRTIAARQDASRADAQARRIGRWHSPLRWMSALGLSSIGASVLLAPGALPEKVRILMGGLCGLRPSHSYFSGGIQQPMESRMMGIYGGFFLSLVVLVALRRIGASRISGRTLGVVLVGAFLSMALDGVNSTLFEIQSSALYAPINSLRLITGLLFGMSVASVAGWLLGGLWPPTDAVRPAVVMTMPVLLVTLGAFVCYGFLVMQGGAWTYGPVAIISIGGVLTLPGSLALVAIGRLAGLRRQVRVPGTLLAPGLLALLVACAIVAGSAVIRWTT